MALDPAICLESRRRKARGFGEYLRIDLRLIQALAGTQNIECITIVWDECVDVDVLVKSDEIQTGLEETEERMRDIPSVWKGVCNSDFINIIVG